MQLFLTGSSKFLGDQLDPFKSIGGFISDSEVQNGALSNVFDQISSFTKQQQNKKEIRVLAIKNDSNFNYQNVKVWTEYPFIDQDDDSDSTTVEQTNIAIIKIGYQAVTADGCGDLLTQKLQTIYSTPYSVTLTEADGVLNQIALPDIASGNYLAIFIQRVLKTDVAYTDDQLLEILEGTLVPDTIEDISLNFSWDEV